MLRLHVILIVCLLIGGAHPALADPEPPLPDFVTYPIVTHYPEPGGAGPAPQRGMVQVSYANYHNRLNDPFAPSREQVAAFTSAVMVAADFTPLHLLNDWEAVQEGIDAIQMVNNVPVEGALYTIVLPPGWVRSGSYPVMLSGNGAGTSNNERLYGAQEIHAPLLAWHSVQQGRSGIILAVSNCGGTESQGIDELTLRSVGAFFDFIAEHGGDKHKAVTTGGSRGGGTALVWAANPLDLDYTVNAVFAHVPPTHYGTLGAISLLTYPAMGSIAELVWGAGGAGFDEGPDTMQGRLADVLHTLSGTEDIDTINARGPIGLAERLRGKTLLISEGTHDSFFQLALFLAFDRKLSTLGIDHATAIILGDGHTMSDWLYAETLAYLEGLTGGEAYTPPTGRRYFINKAGAQVPLEDFLGYPVAALPFTVELPARSAPGLPIDVSACGAVGAAWTVGVNGPDGSPVWEQSGIFDGSECATFHLVTPDTPGLYTWYFNYAGQDIPPTNTPFRDAEGCGVPAVTEVLPQEPPLDARYYEPGYLAFGIDQFIAEAEGCPATAIGN